MIADGFDIGLAHALWAAGYLAALALVVALVALFVIAGIVAYDWLELRTRTRLDILRNRN